jgi:hypothetical protein
MRRREFIMLLAGAALAWPLVARAQQPERMRRIGVLTGIAGDDLESKARDAAFVKELQRLGLDRGAQCTFQLPLVWRQCCRCPQIRGGIGHARVRRNPGHWNIQCRPFAPGNSHRARRIHDHDRPGRRRLG